MTTINVSNKAMADHGIAAVTFESDNLPAQTIASLLQRGASHYFGNVFQSGLLSVERKFAAGNGKASDVTEAQLTAWREANAVVRSDEARKLFAEMVAAVNDGTIGMPSERSTEAALSPVERKMRELAIATIRATLAGKSISLPRKFDAAVKGVELPDGNGGTFVPTVDQLIARQLTGAKAADYQHRAEQAIAAEQRAVKALLGEDSGL